MGQNMEQKIELEHRTEFIQNTIMQFVFFQFLRIEFRIKQAMEHRIKYKMEYKIWNSVFNRTWDTMAGKAVEIEEDRWISRQEMKKVKNFNKNGMELTADTLPPRKQFLRCGPQGIDHRNQILCVSSGTKCKWKLVGR